MSFLNLEKVNMLKYAEVTGCTSADGPIVWLEGHGLLSQRRVCSKCSSSMSLQNKTHILDKKVWRCSDYVSTY